MDRITQLQDEIQKVGLEIALYFLIENDVLLQVLMIMSNTIAYLTKRPNFLQVSEDVPVTRRRGEGKFDPPEVFEGTSEVLVVSVP